MADYLHPGQTTTGQYYAEPTFKLLEVMKQKHRRKLSLKECDFFTTMYQRTSHWLLRSSPWLNLFNWSSEPSYLQCRFGSQWLFPNKKSEVPSLWLVYRRWITEDHCRGMVWVKQKILFSRYKLRRKVEKMHWRCRKMSKNDSMWYNMLIFIAKLQN